MDIAGTQYFNEGNLRPTDPSQPSINIPGKGTFRNFKNEQEGGAALMNDIQAKISGNNSHGLGPNSTLVDFAKVYAPELDDNKPANYAAQLANQLKVSPGATLGSLEPRIGEFAQAVSHNEGYQWADQPATDQTTDPTATGNSILDFGKTAADWLWGHDIPQVTGAVATGGLLAGPALAGLAGVSAADTAATGGGILSKIGGFFGKSLPLAAEGYAADEIIRGVTGKNTTPQSQPQDQQTTQPQMNFQGVPEAQLNASHGLYSAYQQSFNGSQAGRVNLNDPSFRDGITSASVAGRGPDTSTGFNDFSQAEKERATEAAATHKLGTHVVGEGKFSPSEAAKLAEQYLPSNLSPKERKAAVRHVRSEAASYGKSISLAAGHEARVQQYASTKGQYNTANKPSAHIMAHKALARGFKESVLAHTPNKKAYERLLKHEQDLKMEQKVYKMLNGKKALNTHNFTKGLHGLANRAFASYVGDKVGGILGAVLGNVILDIGQKSADKRFGKNVFDDPKVRAGIKVLKEELPSRYKQFKAEMESKGIKFPSTEEKGASSEEGLIKDMKQGGVTKQEKVLTSALKMSKEQLIRKKNPSVYKSSALKKAKSKRLSYHDRTMA